MMIKWKNNGRYKLLSARFLFDTSQGIDVLMTLKVGMYNKSRRYEIKGMIY